MSEDPDRIVETPEEAREGENIAGMTTVLRVSVVLTVIGFAALLLFFYGRSAGWFR